MNHSNQENMDVSHEHILNDGKTRFPMESYLQLIEKGANQKEALELLGYDPDHPPVKLPSF